MKNTLSLFLLVFATTVIANAQPVRELDLKECLQLRQRSMSIIDNDNDLWSAVRKDGSQERCITMLQQTEIDLTKDVLVGANINSGYCRRPPGLKAEVVNDDELLTSTVRISYIEPKHGSCAAVSSFVYWILVPKPRQGFTIKIDAGRRQESSESDSGDQEEMEY